MAKKTIFFNGSKQFTLRFEPDFLVKLKQEAKNINMTQSQFLRMIAYAYFEKNTETKSQA